MIHSEERFPCLEKAGEATLEVAKEETPKAKGSKEESQAAMNGVSVNRGCLVSASWKSRLLSMRR